MVVAARVLIPILLLMSLAGCASVKITSDPSGAEIYYSETGIEPWKPWPPGSDQPQSTPDTKVTKPEPFLYVRVEKDGYYPVRPVFLDAGILRRQRVHFLLDQTFRQQQLDKGLVIYQNEWITPEEKFQREQEAKGLFLHEPSGRWVTEPEMEALKAEAKRAAGYVWYLDAWVKPEEEGLVQYKTRWMKPEEAERQRRIDRRVQDILASGKTVPLQLTRTRPTVTEGTQLWIADLTGHPLEVLISGLVSQEDVVLAYNKVTLESEPGTYTVVLRDMDRPEVPASVVTMEFKTKQSYSWAYHGPNSPTKASVVEPTQPRPVEVPGLIPDSLAPEGR